MKYVLFPQLPDGGGDLAITAENAEEVQYLTKTFKLFCRDSCSAAQRLKSLEEEAASLRTGTCTVLREHRRAEGREPSAWYPITDVLDAKRLRFNWEKRELGWLDPYKSLLKEYLGYTQPLPDMPLVVPGDEQIHGCLILLSAEIKNEQLGYTCYVHSESGEAHARDYAKDYLEEYFGGREREPEFRETANGQYQHNPDYLKRHKATPAVGCDWFLNQLLGWWRKTQANPAQLQILERAEALMKDNTIGRTSPLQAGYSHGIANYSTTYSLDWGIYYLHPGGTVNWDGKGTKVAHMKWSEFAVLK